jgi:hypothetical protein
LEYFLTDISWSLMDDVAKRLCNTCCSRAKHEPQD